MKEEEIRPQDVFDEYLRLAEDDVVRYFHGVPRLEVACPACGNEGQFAFKKKGFDYRECPDCGTLWVSPRPPADVFARYYQESASVKFWATTFYRITAEARRDKLWKPKAEMVWNILKDLNANKHQVIDIGGGYGIFAEEFQKMMLKPVTVIEPGPLLADVCRKKGLRVIDTFLEDIRSSDLPTGMKAFVSFELFEHLHDPASFLAHLSTLMDKGDLFLFTTLSGLGVDIQALWMDSKSVTPPHHLNFFNPYSARLILQKQGMKILNISTPGKLDIDILCNNKDQIKDRFWKNFIQHADEEQKSFWQKAISESGWSSHMMVLAQKP